MPAYFVVRAVVSEADRRDFDVWYRTEHLPDARAAFKAQSAWRAWSRTDPSVHYAFYQFADGAAAAYLHLARTICRRAERLTAELKDKAGESVTPEVLKYLNRLSDYLFVASRYANGKGAADVLWKPGENR